MLGYKKIVKIKSLLIGLLGNQLCSKCLFESLEKIFFLVFQSSMIDFQE